MYFAVTKGTSANMMKVESKRRRGKKQIEEDKQAEIAKEVEAQNYIVELARLKEKVRRLESSSKKGKQASSIVHQMIASGFVQQDADDSIILNGNEGAQQRIQADRVDSDEEFFEADQQ